MTIPCIVCKKELTPVFKDTDSQNQASGACAFISYGQYGSTFFDSAVDEGFMEINICDECLKKNTSLILRGTTTTTKKTMYTPLTKGMIE